MQPQKVDPGPTYPVVHCSAPDNTFSDRNGTFHTRYNCNYNNVNWGYKVVLPLQAIAAGPMNEAGMRWYKGTGHYLGANAPPHRRRLLPPSRYPGRHGQWRPDELVGHTDLPGRGGREPR
ncbi:hypothetical protein [Streptacidiphilus neutrinimicus]|uniref:hypothetical protein n=1 Tax=Streptacidiphilus neutrinimicus TaxID=105420 RepID=UPI0005AB0B81|nr:hypothetical protein [Streptacidiphilus neutrinimicus]